LTVRRENMEGHGLALNEAVVLQRLKGHVRPLRRQRSHGTWTKNPDHWHRLLRARGERRKERRPPRIVMTSRRLMRPPPWLKGAHYHVSKRTNTVPLFDHRVGAREYRLRHRDPDGPGCCEVDNELEFGRPGHWQVRGFFSLEDASGIDASLATLVCG